MRFYKTIDEMGGREYRRPLSEKKHQGQLKLLCCEIQFLTPFKGVTHTVIYAGSSPGKHIPILIKLFPEMRYILVDPLPSAVYEIGVRVIEDAIQG